MKTYKILGLMSGTSLDGLDLAYCHIHKNEGQWSYDLKACKSLSYESELRQRLKDSVHLSPTELLALHHEYGRWLGATAKSFIEEEGLEVDAIASHGHTPHHQPKMRFTFQLGYGQDVAIASGLPTIADFRSFDVALDGQGAPLVPIGDRLFFSSYTFCLNLGGISNISFEQNGQRIAYDIGLANMILNYLSEKIDLPYDKDGELARKGTLIPELYSHLNELPYYREPIPKSVGYEWFLSEVVPLVESVSAPVEDLLHTAVHHICEQLASAIHSHNKNQDADLFVTGGGALNGFLLETLKAKLGNQVKVVVPDRTLIEFKEALVFALMGALRLEGEINVLHSVTGARRDSCSGLLFIP